MPVVKRTLTRYGRRRYYRNGYRRYRSVSNQYFRTRIEGIYTIAFPAQSGAPVFAENESRTVTFSQLFGGSQYYGSLIYMFGFYKVTGVSMEVTPGPSNFKGTATVGAKTLVGFRSGNSTTMSYHELVADNNSILLGVDTKKRKYVSLMGSNGWLPTVDSNPDFGAFSVGSSVNGTLNNQPTWTCRFSLYMTFKKVNI